MAVRYTRPVTISFVDTANFDFIDKLGQFEEAEQGGDASLHSDHADEEILKDPL